MENLTKNEALVLAVQMLEHISKGGSYAASEFHDKLHAMKKAVAEDFKPGFQGFEKTEKTLLDDSAGFAITSEELLRFPDTRDNSGRWEIVDHETGIVLSRPYFLYRAACAKRVEIVKAVRVGESLDRFWEAAHKAHRREKAGR